MVADAADDANGIASAVRILMIRLPAWPSRLKAISIPSVCRDVCARHRWPASARGFLGQSRHRSKWIDGDHFLPLCVNRRVLRDENIKKCTYVYIQWGLQKV
jgi:hypothetical protein